MDNETNIISNEPVKRAPAPRRQPPRHLFKEEAFPKINETVTLVKKVQYLVNSKLKFKDVVYQKKVASHIARCKYKCCKKYGVNLEHMEKAANNLNGRKIDGIYVNDLLGRQGFYDGSQVSRADVAAKYKTGSFQVEVADGKFAGILLQADPIKGYQSYIDILRKEEDRKISEKVDEGE